MSDESWILRELVRCFEEDGSLAGFASALVNLTHRLVFCEEVTVWSPDGVPLASDVALDAVALRGPSGRAWELLDRRGSLVGVLRVTGCHEDLAQFAEYAGFMLAGCWRLHRATSELSTLRLRASRLERWASSVEPLLDTLTGLSAESEEELLARLSSAWESLTGYELAVLFVDGAWRWSPGGAWEGEALEVARGRLLVIDDLVATRFTALSATCRCFMVVPVGSRGFLFLGHSSPGVWERLECQLVWWTTSFLDTWLSSLGRSRQQQQAARMAALGQLAAGMAHEVNNPLGTILIALRTLQKTSPGPMVEAGVAACKRAQEIVEKLLRYSRSDQGSRTRAFLGQLTSEAVELLALSGLSAEVSVQDEVLVLVCPGDIQQVVVNLVLNARDVSPSVAVRVYREGSFGVVEVLDEGPGVDPALAERVFEPFFTTKDVGKGTGLGLAISRTIAEDHGGSLTLENRPSGGAVGRLRVPCGNA